MEAVGSVHATYAQLEALPPHVVGEIVDGELVVSPRPAGAHAFTTGELHLELGQAFGRVRGPGGWWIFVEPELHLGSHVLVPDLAGWRFEEMQGPYLTAACEVTPSWVCEVLSPRTARLDRIRKMRLYAQVGVRHAWLVDPLARTLEVYRLDGEHYTFAAAHEADETVHAEPFETHPLDLALLWPPEPAPPDS